MKRCRRIAFVLAILICGPAKATTPPPAYKVTLLHPGTGYDNSYGSDTFDNRHVFEGRPQFGLLHAFLWNGSSLVNLTPTGFTRVAVHSIHGNSQAGFGGGGPTDGATHALKWDGTAASFVDLHPIGYRHSRAVSVWGDVQAGNAYPIGELNSHAMIWRGTAASAVDLHPAGFDQSVATDVEGDTQVGFGYLTSVFFSTHALMWHGTASSVVDLHPAGFSHSSISGISGNTQVGHGYINPEGGPPNALMWHGTSENIVNLNPPGFFGSFAHGVVDERQVGYGQREEGGNVHALFWNGTAQSAVDLHQYLVGLPENLTDSYAFRIGANGTIIGNAHDQNIRYYAVLWTPIPEPTTLTLLIGGLAMVQFVSTLRSRPFG